MSHHAARPIPAKRMYVEPHYPTRESDGEAHIGQMLDTRQLRIRDARDASVDWLMRASAARLRGDGCSWGICMTQAAINRAKFAGLLRSGGRVDWRGHPVQENE